MEGKMKKLNRRAFLKTGAAALGTTLAPTALLSGCAGMEIRHPKESVDDIINQGARVMWIGAHPDDEVLVGAILAWSSLVKKNPLYMLVLNHGDGGECLLPEGCRPDLATVRGEEMKKVAALYNATLQHEYYYNCSLPVESFPKRHEIAEIWKKKKDPALVCAKAIREFRPDLLLTFHPINGATGHPEHQIASRFATAGVRMAADADESIGELKPHRVSHVYYGINRYWPIVMLGKADPAPVTEAWSGLRPCVNGMTCMETMAEFTRPHKTQARDMGSVRKISSMLKFIRLQKTDPFTQIYDPYEPVA